MALTACGGNSAEPEVVTETVTAEPSPQEDLGSTTATDREDIFIDTVRDEIPALRAIPENEILSLAGNVCGGLDNGATVLDVAGVFIDNGIPATDAGYFIGASVGAFCPEYTQDIEDLQAEFDTAT